MARGATLRRDLVNVPARFAAPARKPDAAPASPLALANSDGKPCGTTSSATRPPNPAPPDPTRQPLSTPPSPARPEEPRNKEKLVQASRSRMRHRATPGRISPKPANDHTKSPIHGFRLRDEGGHDRRGIAPGGCADGADWFVERSARKPLHEFR